VEQHGRIYAGKYLGSGSLNETSTDSIYLGYNTKASVGGTTRENIIGFELTGSGDNTTTIGEKPVFPQMPTSTAGLPVGALWCDTTDNNTIKQVR